MGKRTYVRSSGVWVDISTPMGLDNVTTDGAQTISNKTLGSNLDANGFTVTGLAAPSSSSDAATKAYVDATAQGLDVKSSCVVATTTNITLSGLQLIDGYTTLSGDRVLVKNQTTDSENGIYVASASTWSRADDAAENGELTPGTFTFVERGSAQADSGWVITTNGTITIGATAITWAQFSGAGQITAGAGLTKTGNTLDVGAGYGISVATDSVAVDRTYVSRVYYGADAPASPSLGDMWVESDVDIASTAAQISIGTVTTGAAGSSATVTNTGTGSNAVLAFSIPQGATGATGATGSSGGIRYQASTSTTASDPGSGFFRWNNATASSVTQIYISETDYDAGGRQGVLDLVTNTSSSIRGTIYIQNANGFNIAVFNVTGAGTDNGTWRTIPVSWVSGSTTLTANEIRHLWFIRAGDIGETGKIESTIDVSTTSRTLATTDVNDFIRMTSSSANTVSVTTSLNTLADGSMIHIQQAGTGKTTISAGAGVTINTTYGLLLRTQHSAATLIKIGGSGNNTWTLVGDVSAV